MLADCEIKVELTKEQRQVVAAIVKSGNPVRTLGGYAGTGKTTVIAEIVRRLPKYAVCAYTGKAANVLRRKGIHASTIHSLIYHPVKDKWGVVGFELIPRELFMWSGVIVDEASMVGRCIYDDLKHMQVPLIFVGDHGQLEPVGDTGFNLMQSPDLRLETIHRNAGPISRFAEHLRNGGDAKDWKGDEVNDPSDPDASVCVTTLDAVGRLDINREWQLICAYNRTRSDLNTMVRDHIGMPAGQPEVGDRIICLQNNRQYGLFNGMQGTIAEIDRIKEVLTFNAEQGVEVRVPYIASAFGGDKPKDRRWSIDRIPFDWSYCMTCHKAQGDEFDNVCVIEQHCGMWDHRRWAYTAASRARNKLVWITG